MDVWTCGCVDVWLCGGVWAGGCVQFCGRVGVWAGVFCVGVCVGICVGATKNDANDATKNEYIEQPWNQETRRGLEYVGDLGM